MTVARNPRKMVQMTTLKSDELTDDSGVPASATTDWAYSRRGLVAVAGDVASVFPKGTTIIVTHSSSGIIGFRPPAAAKYESLNLQGLMFMLDDEDKTAFIDDLNEALAEAPDELDQLLEDWWETAHTNKVGDLVAKLQARAAEVLGR